MELRSWSVSRAGEGKNESSTGKRVIVAKDSREQGRAEGHDATGGGYWRVAIGWSLSRQHVGHSRQPCTVLLKSHGVGGRSVNAVAVRI